MTALARRRAAELPGSLVLVALAVVASLCATFGGWAMFARLDSAVVTQGVLLAESQRKTVEHLEGGILEALLVKPGDRVEAGQVVAQLDATQTEEQLAQIEANRLGLAFDIWRLEAEEAGAPRSTRRRPRRRPRRSAATLDRRPAGALRRPAARARRARSPRCGGRSTSSRAQTTASTGPGDARRSASSRAGPRSAR